MKPMKIKTRFYFNDGETLDTASTFEELCQNVDKGITNSNCFLVLDQSGREHLVRWNNVNHAENCYNRFDQLLAHVGEKSELGVAADFVAHTPYSWAFPETNFGQDVDYWLCLHQRDIPANLQSIYMKIASTLLAYWYNAADAPEIDEAMKKMGKTAHEIREKAPGDNAGHYEDQTKYEVKELIKFLLSKMPMIEREYHEKEDGDD